jgi:vacuolar-type H+-ATPase subunit I/STV1
MPAMEADASFRRLGGWAAYLVAGFSLIYAVVYLGFVRTDATNATASTIAWALIAAGALSAALATAAVASYIGGAPGMWLAAFGVGSSLLSGTHGAYAAIADIQGFADLDLSPTDPRGFATFGLVGLWLLIAGLELRGRADLRPSYAQIAMGAGVVHILLFISTLLGNTPLVLITGGLASVLLGPAFWLMTGRLLTAER